MTTLPFDARAWITVTRSDGAAEELSVPTLG
jgi:hypothetical protein